MKTLTSPIQKFDSPETVLTVCEKYVEAVPLLDADGKWSVGRKTIFKNWSYLRETGLMVVSNA